MNDDSRRFWDERADEDAFYFVDNRLTYGSPDLDRFWAEGEQDLDALLGALGTAIDPGDAVLEIGCGVGRLTRVIAGRAATVTALDVSPRMLELAREHNPQLTNVQWLAGDGATLAGVPSGAFNACVSHVVFQHIPEPDVTLSYIREMGRILRPGGWGAFQVSNDPRVHDGGSRATRLRRDLRAAIGRGPGGQNDERWRGSMIQLADLGRAAADGSMDVERTVGEGTQFCCVLTRRR